MFFRGIHHITSVYQLGLPSNYSVFFITFSLLKTLGALEARSGWSGTTVLEYPAASSFSWSMASSCNPCNVIPRTNVYYQVIYAPYACTTTTVPPLYIAITTLAIAFTRHTAVFPLSKLINFFQRHAR